MRHGFHLTIQDVYKNPTLKSQAKHLAGGSEPYGTRALAVRRHGSAPALFVVPTGNGDITYAFELGLHLDVDAPIHALPWPPEMPASMDALAEHMVHLMRQVCPQGPYRLLGYSSGGLLAYATAQLLAELDEPVEFLGLLDCDNPSISPSTETHDELTKQALVDQLRAWAAQEPYRQQDDLQEAARQLELQAPASSLPEFMALCDQSPPLLRLLEEQQASLEQLAAYTARIVQYDRLWPSYLPQPLPGALKLHLFQAMEGTPAPTPGLMKWDQLLPAGQIEVVPVPGTHSTVLEPAHIGDVVRAVSRSLPASRPAWVTTRHAPALPLQMGRAGQVPVICVPGAGASVTSFMELGMALGTEQALIGMQPRGIDGTQLPYGSVEQAAMRYVEAMQPFLSQGDPVHLVGHSFGGWVAFEMSRRLRSGGTEVASLTMVDVRAPDDASRMCDRSRNDITDRYLQLLSMHGERPLPIDPASLHALTPAELIEALHRVMVDMKLMPASSKPHTLRGPFFAFARAYRVGYCPATAYDGPVHLVLVPDSRLSVEEDIARRHRVEATWRRHAPALSVWQGPGNHMTVLAPPHVRALAHWWRTTVLEALPAS